MLHVPVYEVTEGHARHALTQMRTVHEREGAAAVEQSSTAEVRFPRLRQREYILRPVGFFVAKVIKGSQYCSFAPTRGDRAARLAARALTLCSRRQSQKSRFSRIRARFRASSRFSVTAGTFLRATGA